MNLSSRLPSPRLNHAALLVIDMQRDFCATGGYAHTAGLDISNLRKPIPHIQQLLNTARAQEMLIIHTREGHRSDLLDCTPNKQARSTNAGAPIGSVGPMGRLLIRGEYGHDIIDELAPHAGEPVIDKPGYSAFHQTDLDIMLRNQDIRQLILTGVTTEVCVQSTLREAVDRGYDCITVSDGCGSAYPELHKASLAMIAVEGGIFGTVVSTDTLLKMMRASSQEHHDDDAS
ncbi:cysteine hydrolase family protein [Sulfuriferula thiophila]|uniref:cysteine hydrolase family protein n=1 Tax=Sulfuriferula thiophila TaxID=1781211 RepID=UPI000F608EC6|nr:isochorismatase family cysteine hydrolase [Sulfuriferula thiophila]